MLNSVNNKMIECDRLLTAIYFLSYISGEMIVLVISNQPRATLSDDLRSPPFYIHYLLIYHVKHLPGLTAAKLCTRCDREPSKKVTRNQTI